MLDQWILSKLDPLCPASLILLRDPQRMIVKGARAVDGWAEEHGYSVFFCAGNLGLREMVESARDDAEARVLVVDRSRADARAPLFYPDLDAQAAARCKLTLTLRDYLVQQTSDPRWPQQVAERTLARLILAHLDGVLAAYRALRQVDATRFTDTDLYKLILGAALHVNPFRAFAPADIRRVCIEQHAALEDLARALPLAVMQTLRQAVADAPVPFCYLLDRDAGDVIRAFTLAALLHQHGLDYPLLLPALDPALHDYRAIPPDFLDSAMQDQLAADPDRVLADVQAAERFLTADPQRLACAARDQWHLDDPAQAVDVLRRERLSPLVRTLALLSLLSDLLLEKNLKRHEDVLRLLDQQVADPALPALRRPSETWQALESVYRRAVEVCRLTARLGRYARELAMADAAALSFATFDRLWNEEHLNRLDFYTSDLARAVRVGALLPVAEKSLWPELAALWQKARAELDGLIRSIEEMQAVVDARFQDLYRLRYAEWIRQDDAPVIFTHQVLPRLLKAYWDPQSGRKAVILVFDGLRADAWEELVRPLFEERFEIVARRPGSALIPTETHLSRKAIAAGCLPEAFTSQSELHLLTAWLKGWLGRTAPHLDVVKDDDTLASGMTVRYVSAALEYIVFNFTDRNLHHNPQDLAFIYNVTVREIIRQDVRSVLRELPDDALLLITSDHGFIPMPETTVTIPDALVSAPDDVTYRSARARGKLTGKDAGKVIDFDARQMGLDIPNGAYSTLLFPRPGVILRRERNHRPPDRYSHGGVSLAECMIPLIVMGPRQQDRPVLALEHVRQVGSVSEGEALTLEITVAATQPRLPEMSVTLEFSRDDIPMRREVFSGQRATYTVQWRPQTLDITPEVQAAGRIVLPVTVTLSYRDKGQTVRLSAATDAIVKIEPSRLRRRVDSKLDFLMGKAPKGLRE